MRRCAILLSLHAFYFVLIGAVDLLCVVLAASYLHMGPGGAGYLNAAFGAGALLAGFVTAFLVGRRHLKNTLALSLMLAVAALGLISAIPRVAPAVVLLAAVGLSGAVFDVTGRTLLQRSAPADAIAGLFSILEALMDLGLVLGTVLVQVAMAAGGLRAALLAPAVIAVCPRGGPLAPPGQAGRRGDRAPGGDPAPALDLDLCGPAATRAGGHRP